ncbi:V-type proton ATPase subunit C 1-A [Taenia crassiceps]|uniref:V-type proton ATPase subunit C n=1 Tax=Taenia crassiceps TaxID=6207 RepID=A0ABR4QM34_9CEST
MSDFLIISVPAEGDQAKTYRDLSAGLSKNFVAQSVTEFSVPLNLKVSDLCFVLFQVGTLDVLVGISDELVKLDSYAESVTRKISQYMGDVLEEQRHKLEDNLLVNGLSPSLYISKFQWDTAKYPIKQTLQALHDILSENLSRLEADLRTRSTNYNSIKGALHALEKKQTGSLLTRNLAEIVKKQQFVLGSEYLITVAVVVPRTAYKEWEATYETLADMVVPRSTELIFEDQDNGLWTVTLFQKMLSDFTQSAREKRFIVRDFVYDEKAIEESKNMFSKLEADKKKQFPPLFRWLRVNFGEAFSVMMHIKALRIFVESVLRYGLPVDFEAILIVPNRKNYKRLREVLHNMYEHLDNLALSSTTDEDMIGAGMSHGEYYPYVSISVETNFVDSR